MSFKIFLILIIFGIVSVLFLASLKTSYRNFLEKKITQEIITLTQDHYQYNIDLKDNDFSSHNKNKKQIDDKKLSDFLDSLRSYNSGCAKYTKDECDKRRLE